MRMTAVNGVQVQQRTLDRSGRSGGTEGAEGRKHVGLNDRC